MGGLTLFFKNRKEFLIWAKENKLETFNNGGTSAANNGLSAYKTSADIDITTPKGKVKATQAVVQVINSEKDIEQLWQHYRGNTHSASHVGKKSAILGGVQVILSGLSHYVDDDPFTDPVGDLEAGDLLTAAVTTLTFIPGGQPLAAIVTAGALIYNVYSFITGSSITLEELFYGSHYDALWAFYEQNTQLPRDPNVPIFHEKTKFDTLVDGAGGANMARWIFEGYLGKGTGAIINEDNYQNVLKKLYTGKDEKNKPILNSNGELIKAEGFKITLLNDSTRYILDKLHDSKHSGDISTAKAIIYALENLNPLAVSYPTRELKAAYDSINPDDYSDEWVQARAWMLLESLAEKFKVDDDYTLRTINAIRQEFGIQENDKVSFESGNKETSFSRGTEGEGHRVIFNNGSQGVEGGERNDMIFGSPKNDVLVGNGGDDTLVALGGNDTLKGGSGKNTLNGSNGMDTYVFDTSAKFDDTVIDSDGRGIIEIDGRNLAKQPFTSVPGVRNAWFVYINGNKWNVLLTADGDLVFNEPILDNHFVIRGWAKMENGRMGFVLPEYNDREPKEGGRSEGDWHTEIIDKNNHPEMDKWRYGEYYPRWYDRNPDGIINDGIAEQDFADVINYRNSKEGWRIFGKGGNDALGGSPNNDRIYGGEGNDLIAGGGGSDIIDGGRGDDFIYANSDLTARERRRPDELWEMPKDGKSVIQAGTTWGVYKDRDGFEITDGISSTKEDDAKTGGDYLYGADGNDEIIGSNLNDFIYGDKEHNEERDGNSSYDGVGRGKDKIYGMGGDDFIEGNGEDDFIYGDGLTKSGHLNSVNADKHGRDTINGGNGKDTIIGGGNNDTIHGNEGDDHLYGDQGLGDFSTAQKDWLPNEFQGRDTIFGDAGDDRIMGGGNNDELHGGLGNDTIWGDYGSPDATSRAFGNDTIWGDEGEDEINGGYGTDTIYGGADKDTLRGGAHGDVLCGDDGNDIMFGDGDYCPPELEGLDRMEGGDGDDIMFGCGGGDNKHDIELGLGDELSGGDGNDQIYGNTYENHGADGINYLSGGRGEDKLWGAGNTDHIFGGEDNDQITGYAGDDRLYGEEGDDRIYGDESQSSWRNPYTITGEDRIFGGAGNDYLDGGNGDDQVYGDEGNDIVLGYFGDDYLSGGDGNDDVAGGAGDDYVYGDDGNDIVRGDWPVASLDADPNAGGADHLFGGRGDDQMDGGYGDDELHGDEGNDLLYANAGNDMLFGGEGNDELNAVSGTNRLFGDEGNDILRSGTGNDYLHGGMGNDLYYFKRDFGHDIIDNNDRIKDRVDYIQFDAHNQNEIEFIRENDDLIIRTLEGDNQITVLKHFSEEEPWHFINGILFADGSVLDHHDFFRHDLPHGHNHPPEVVQPLANLAVKADSDIGGQITLDAISDPDGETLVYQLTLSDGIALPEWLQFDAQTGAIRGHAPADSSLLHLRLTGTDHAGESAFTDFTLQVNAAPQVAHSLDNHRAVEGQDFSFQLPSDTFVDPESDPLNLQLLQGNGEALPDWLHFDAASATVSGHAPVGAPDLSLSLIATDPLGNQAHADFSLALTEPPQSVKTSWRGGTVHGKDGDDQLIGSNFNDRLFGEDGNDYLKAKFGNDVLDGGRGDDRMEGDWGNDEYHYRAGDGHDTIHDSHGKDTLILDGIRQGDTHFLLRGNDLVLEFAHDGGSIVIENHTGHGRIEHFRFADVNLDHHAVDDLLRQLGNHQHGVM